MSSAAGVLAIKGRLCERTQPVVVQLGGGLAGRRAMGCDADSPPAPPAAPPVEASTKFDPQTAGEVAGRVTWAGDVPVAPPFEAPVSPLCEQVRGPKRNWPYLNAPSIGSQNRGVANTVVFLRGVDPHRARPWDIDPGALNLAMIRSVSAKAMRTAPSASSAAATASTWNRSRTCFTRSKPAAPTSSPRPFPMRARWRTDSRPRRRRGTVQQRGAVLDAAYLFVDDHPYYARTAADGRDALEKVPPGDYDLVCWMPDWRGVARDRRRYAARHTADVPAAAGSGAASPHRPPCDGGGGFHAIAGRIRRRQTERPLNKCRFSTGSRSVNGPSARSRLRQRTYISSFASRLSA